MEINKIFEMMTRQGKSGKDLAVYLNVTQQTVTNWKIGVSESYKKRLPEIAVFLNTTVEELAGIPLHGDKPDCLSEHEAQLIHAYRTNTKMQEAVDTLLGLSHEKRFIEIFVKAFKHRDDIINCKISAEPGIGQDDAYILLIFGRNLADVLAEYADASAVGRDKP